MSPSVTRHARLGDDILKIFNTFYSWDVGSTLVTPAATIFNTDISPGVGHFPRDIERLRKPPYNMITVDEAWHHFERGWGSWTPCPRNTVYRAWRL